MKGQQIVECVPNFSEGREEHVVRSIVNEIRSVPNIRVLDVHSDRDHNRSVVTFIGGPDEIEEAALACVRAASRMIDLKGHRGVHPRLGAADVIPFVPIRNVEIEDCMRIARKVAKRIWQELEIPTYLYGHAALRGDRARLENVRFKGFEQVSGLVESEEDKRPDFGGPKLHPKAGATIVGARYPMIAFNVDLDSRDVNIAKEIASRVREKNSGLAGVKALGRYLESKSCIQVSTNITRTDSVSPNRVFEAIESEASDRGIDVLRGELVGLMPIKSAVSSIQEILHLEDFSGDRIIEMNL